MDETKYILIYQCMGNRNKQFSDTVEATSLQFAIRQGKRSHPGYRLIGAYSEAIAIEQFAIEAA